MANLMLGHPNIFDRGNLSGGIWRAGQPLASLQFRQIGRVARTEDASEDATQFAIDYLTPRPIRLIALVNHSISFGGRIVYEASDTISFDNLIYQATEDAWATLGAAEWVLDELEWEADNFWNGTYALDQIEGLTTLSYHVLPQEVSARFWRVRIIDTGNTDGYVEIGRVFMGAAWSPAFNMIYGASFGYEAPTSVDTAMGGAEYFDERAPFRVFRFRLALLETATEGYAQVLEMQRSAGVSGEVLVIPDPADRDNAQRLNFLGRLRQLSPLELTYPEYSGMSFEVKEIK